ncbi:MAG: hypothetical protein HC906_19480 [Bacteroidales bacterium]|nr:hypothetical protein [Bacteroidales bacterium]
MYVDVAQTYATSDTSSIKIHIYQGGVVPGEIIFTKEIGIFDLVPDELNFISLDTIITVEDDFFIGYEINYSDESVFSTKMTLEEQDTNTAYVYLNNEWIGMDEYTPANMPHPLI